MPALLTGMSRLRLKRVWTAWMLHFGVPLGTHPKHPVYFLLTVGPKHQH